MANNIFPPVDQADPSGLLAIGGNLDLETLKLAYSQGIFPWPFSDRYPMSWFSPDPRGLLEFDQLQLSTSFKKFLKKNPFEVKFNTQFERVIEECSQSKNRGFQQGTWITRKIIEGYTQFYQAGFAYCVEAYREDRLVGGLYGVCIDSFISGESMFYLEDNASKVALYSLIMHLKSRGITWMDTQMVTPIVSSFGGKEVRRNIFMQKLSASLKNISPARHHFPS